ncbi:unnamed protein product, partial [Heterotrigona itama]
PLDIINKNSTFWIMFLSAMSFPLSVLTNNNSCSTKKEVKPVSNGNCYKTFQIMSTPLRHYRSISCTKHCFIILFHLQKVYLLHPQLATLRYKIFNTLCIMYNFNKTKI